jgi:hypothetical protein
MEYTTRIITEDHKKFIVTLDENGKRIGKRQRWHGESIQSPEKQKNIIKEAQHYQSTKSTPIISKRKKEPEIEVIQIIGEPNKKEIAHNIKNWKNEGFAIPSSGKKPISLENDIDYTNFKTGTRFTEKNILSKFEYTIRMIGIENDDKTRKIEKIVTVTNNSPMTRKQIEEELKDYIRQNKHDQYLFSLKSFRVLNLLLNKYANYDYSYKA